LIFKLFGSLSSRLLSESSLLILKYDSVIHL
jgi:hypothetical protein